MIVFLFVLVDGYRVIFVYVVRYMYGCLRVNRFYLLVVYFIFRRVKGSVWLLRKL